MNLYIFVQEGIEYLDFEFYERLDEVYAITTTGYCCTFKVDYTNDQMLMDYISKRIKL